MTRALRRAVVTGGAGLIGSHLCEQLLAEGCSVVCVDNLVTGSYENVARLDADSRFSFVKRLFAILRPGPAPFSLPATKTKTKSNAPLVLRRRPSSETAAKHFFKRLVK